MKQMILQVDGMMCGMCESHVNDAIRRAFPVKKVSSSHTKGKTVILTEEDLSEEEIRKTVEDTGYRVLSISCEPYIKKGFFSFF